MADPSPSKNKKKNKGFDFEKLGAKVGGSVSGVVAAAVQHGKDLTITEMLELSSRPFRGVCLLCGEPQDPPGSAFGANCNRKIRAAGMSIIMRAEESVKSLTMADIVEIVKAAKEAGFFTTDEPGDEPEKKPTGRTKNR